MFGIVYGSDSDNKIMNRFVDEYELWCNEGKNPDIASIDLDFALDLQKKRLDEKGVKIQTAFTDKETVKNEVALKIQKLIPPHRLPWHFRFSSPWMQRAGGLLFKKTGGT